MWNYGNRIKSNNAMALTSVMSKWCATCIIPRLEKDKEPEETKQLQVGGIDGISSQHLQVLMTQMYTSIGSGKKQKEEHVARK